MDTGMERLAWILSLYGQDLVNMFSGIQETDKQVRRELLRIAEVSGAIPWSTDIIERKLSVREHMFL